MFFKKNFLLLFLLLIFNLAAINKINKIDDYIFDEIYHIPTAQLIANNSPKSFEWWHSHLLNEKNNPYAEIDYLHPPFFKYIQALSILIFGDNKFGWRIPSLLFANLNLILIYLICKQYFQKNQIADGAVLLTILSPTFFTESLVGKNDISATFFILLFLFFSFKFIKRKKLKLKNIFWLALIAGIGLATKWNNFVLVLFFTLILIQYLRKKYYNKKQKLKKMILLFFRNILLFLSTIFLIYLSSYFLMFFQGKDFSYFFKLQKQIIHYQTNLESQHQFKSKPIDWFFGKTKITYWPPHQFYFPYLKNQESTSIKIEVNNSIFKIKFVVLLLLSLFLFYFKSQQLKKKKYQESLIFFSQFLIIFYLLTFLSPRALFFYHTLPTIPIINILLSFIFFQLTGLRCQKSKI